MEAMECGEYFPPIKLVRDPKTGLYILLDGKHRLEAYIMRNEAEIMADILYLPEEHWLMASARFNSKSSKPLTANETKIIIIQTWNSGIKDTDEIAQEMGCTPRYVNIILKPVRDEERLKRKEVISELNEQGLSQREIASKCCVSVGCINKVLRSNGDDSGKETLQQNSNEKFSEFPGKSAEEDQVFTKGSYFLLETPNEENNFSLLDDSPKNNDQNCDVKCSNTSPDSESKISAAVNPQEVFTKGSDFLLETPDEEINISQLKSTPQKVSPDSEKISPENSSAVSAAAALSGNDSQNDRIPLTQKPSRYPSYMDQIDLYNELTPQGQHAIRAMELAKKYKVDILDIAKEIGEPVIWTKKVLMSAIALSLMNGDKLNIISRVETAIGIDFYIAEAIQAMLPFQTMLCPVAPEMEQWIKDNLSSQDLDIILDLIEAPKNDIPYFLKGQRPPAPKKNCFQELPKSYKENFQAYRSMLRELRDHTKNKMFKGNSVRELMAQFNKNMIIVNEITDDLREEELF
ncbi:MAG: hypothetical protein WA017_02695 [Desulfosalsimonadaceae bacterium]